MGQPAGDEAASDRAGGGATTTGPKGPDAADAAQGAVDPPRSDDDAAVGRGDWEADLTDAPPPIHGNDAASSACRCCRRGTTLLSGGMGSVARRGDCGCFLRGPHSAVDAREKNPCQLICLSLYIYFLFVCTLYASNMLYRLCLSCVGCRCRGITHLFYF
ncbi:hypothetical protein TcCL_NonESM05652 [Trypanosoma cruzi]|nr:hypothetical protein TcCL_NonESM05652 [Trypanosoma cruzi]